jgi:succinate dehydrogenase / fumarate reductase cytochrome b subunit
VTGGALTVALVLLAWWLLALAGGPESFATVRAVMDNFFGGIVLFGITACLWYHSLNGVRHLVWDTGRGLSREAAKQSGVMVFVATAALTIVTWIAILLVG